MSRERLAAPVFSPGEKVRGPASYFASIEKTYGKPVQEWIDLVDDRREQGEAHMKVVEFLKAEHGMGHGHANAVVAWVKQQRS